jgi:hypothetical protein
VLNSPGEIIPHLPEEQVQDMVKLKKQVISYKIFYTLQKLAQDFREPFQPVIVSKEEDGASNNKNVSILCSISSKNRTKMYYYSRENRAGPVRRNDQELNRVCTNREQVRA